MVRHKTRYIVLELFSPVERSSQEITSRSIYDVIRASFQDLYGEFGIAQIGYFGVKYFDQTTRIFIIQCRRDFHRKLLHAITFVKEIKSKPCIFSSLHIGATMKSCQKFLMEYSRKELFKVLEDHRNSAVT